MSDYGYLRDQKCQKKIFFFLLYIKNKQITNVKGFFDCMLGLIFILYDYISNFILTSIK